VIIGESSLIEMVSRTSFLKQNAGVLITILRNLLYSHYISTASHVTLTKFQEVLKWQEVSIILVL